MKTIYFKCELLTDIVLNQKAATEGNQESLDFIPGNNFLGIAASQLYEKHPEKALKLFHSKTVRFGDAHPVKIADGKAWRSLRIPACLYRPKLKDKEGMYVYHEIDNPDEPEYVAFQPKQCRTGFYLFENETLREIEVKKSFAIKSAYDREKRRSADSSMYGYESLQSGSTWMFEVTVEDESLAPLLIDALKGTRRVGRSRTAQYGLVEIEELKDTEVVEIASGTQDKTRALVYADSRLIFFDKYGLPTFCPDAERDFGFQNAKINWKKTQIRTFQYAPWNGRRKSRDTDRCGIEKGSVFFIEAKDTPKELIYPDCKFVGEYQNEGFGHILINPDFLRVEQGSGSNRKAAYKMGEPIKVDLALLASDVPVGNDPLVRFLLAQQKAVHVERDICASVNKFVKNHKSKFTNNEFASQWGNIRSIAMTANSRDTLWQKLFRESQPKGYLVHGVAAERWKKDGIRILKAFIKETEQKSSFTDKDTCLAVINLSAEMAKLPKEQ